MARATIITHNNFHGTVAVQYPQVHRVNDYRLRLTCSRASTRRAERRLCGIAGCRCGSHVSATVRGLNTEYKIVETQYQADGSVIHDAMRADVA